MVLVGTGNIAAVNVTVPTLLFFHIHCTGLHDNEGGDIYDRTIPTQMSLQKGDKDLPCKTVQCTPKWWRHRAAGATVPRTSLGGAIRVENVDPRIPLEFPMLPLKLLHPIFGNEAGLESMPPLGQTLDVVDMTMIDALKGDGDPMVFNTKKGGGGEGEEKGGVHPSTLVPCGEGVTLQIGMPRPCRLGVEGLAGGGVLPMLALLFLGLALQLAPASSQVPRDPNPRGAIRHLPFPKIQTHPAIRYLLTKLPLLSTKKRKNALHSVLGGAAVHVPLSCQARLVINLRGGLCLKDTIRFATALSSRFLVCPS